MKKKLSAVLALLLSAAIMCTACGGDKNKTDDDTPVVITAASETDAEGNVVTTAPDTSADHPFGGRKSAASCSYRNYRSRGAGNRYRRHLHEIRLRHSFRCGKAALQSDLRRCKGTPVEGRYQC